MILDLKREYPNWGAPKIREKIIKKFPDVKTPAKSTVHAVLDRHGLIKHRLGRRRFKATAPPLSTLKSLINFGVLITKVNSCLATVSIVIHLLLQTMPQDI